MSAADATLTILWWPAVIGGACLAAAMLMRGAALVRSAAPLVIAAIDAVTAVLDAIADFLLGPPRRRGPRRTHAVMIGVREDGAEVWVWDDRLVEYRRHD